MQTVSRCEDVDGLGVYLVCHCSGSLPFLGS